MGYKLCTAEKPSVARDIARVIGANERKNGYYIGNGYIVTWAVGHLVGLAEPEEYGFVSKDDMWDREQPQHKTRAFEELPLLPATFKTVVLEPTKDQFQVMKDLMHRDDVDYIIDCGDMGSEGHILQWLIREKAGNTKPIKRFCATSMTDEAIKESMAHLRNASDFQNVILGEFCKKRADWIMGMSMSRCASIKYNARVDVGRVQSPTLYFIVKRFIDVNNFKVTDYYQLQADFFEGFKTFWFKDADNRFLPSDKDSDNRLLNKAVADKAANIIKLLKTGTITDLELKKKATDRPQLYDITELQRDGNRIYGYTASEVLETAQSLYETHKVLSYPRTDSRYITTDLVPYMVTRVQQISSIQQYADMANAILKSGLNIDKKIVDNSKVTDHHALTVTERIHGFDVSRLNDREKNIFHLVIVRMLVSFCQKYTYDETVLIVTFGNGMNFVARGRNPVSMGWKAAQKSLMGKDVFEDEEKENEDEQFFPNVQKGQTVNIKDITVLSKKTTPPKLHTEATLLTAMENAGSAIENGAILKGKGIGTQATRAAIIKSLFDKSYVVNKQVGKTNYLVPTRQGINTIKVIPCDLYSPKITADWEEKIAKIVGGKLTEQDFMNDFVSFIKDKVHEVKVNEIKGADFTFAREEFAKCPWCKSSVYEGQLKKDSGKKVDSYYCSAKCGFSVQKDNVVFVARTRKNLTTAQIRKLITAGSVTASCVNKNDVKYTGSFTIVKSPKGYATLEFGFVDESKKKGKRK